MDEPRPECRDLLLARDERRCAGQSSIRISRQHGVTLSYSIWLVEPIRHAYSRVIWLETSHDLTLTLPAVSAHHMTGEFEGKKFGRHPHDEKIRHAVDREEF